MENQLHGRKGRFRSVLYSNVRDKDGRGLPWGGAILVEKIKVRVCDELTSIDPWLDGSETPEDSDLLHVADHGHHLQPLALGVDGVEAAHQVLQEQLECLRQTEHSLAVDHKSCNFLSPVLDHLAVVSCGIVGWDHGWWRPGVAPVVQHQVRVISASLQAGEFLGGEALREGDAGNAGQTKVWRSRQHGGHGDHRDAWGGERGRGGGRGEGVVSVRRLGGYRGGGELEVREICRSWRLGNRNHCRAGHGIHKLG